MQWASIADVDDIALTTSEANRAVESIMDTSHTRFDKAGVALMHNLHDWRLRAVERVELSSALWSERHREIHINPMREFMRDQSGSPYLEIRRADGGRSVVELLLPITELPKVPLLDLKITVAGQRVYRVSKDVSARIQARYVIELAQRANLLKEDSEDFIDFLTFLFFFPSYPYERHLRNYNRLFYPAQDDVYIKPALQFPSREFNAAYREWSTHARKIRRLAKEYCITDYASGAENPLAALPYLFQELRAREPAVELTVKQVTDLMEYLRGQLEEAADMVKETQKSSSNPGTQSATKEKSECARRFLSAYFAYGYRWMAFARCVVPLDEPFLIEVEEKRAIYFSPGRRLNRKSNLWKRFRKEAWQMVSVADAETNHVSIRVTDTAVRLIGRPRVRDELFTDLNEQVEEEEGTHELCLRQDSNRERRERIYIGCRLGLTGIHSWMLRLTIVLTLLGIMIMAWRGPAGYLTGNEATVILIPVSFSAAFLLAREASTLSARVKIVHQWILLIELFALLGLSFILLMLGCLTGKC